MTRAESERLMRYLDGELEPSEAAEVERWVESSKEAQALLADLAAVGSAVSAIALERTEPIPDLTNRILERAAASPGFPSNVVRLGRYWAPAAAMGLAAAAAFALFLRPARPPAAVSVTTAPIISPAKEAASSPVVTAEVESESPGEGEGAEIESVDFGAQGGSIFMVASGPQVTPVVWLVDEPGSPGGRMKPL